MPREEDDPPERPCLATSRSSVGSSAGARRSSCSRREQVLATCDQLLDIMDKYDLPCTAKTTSDDSSYFKFPKFRKSQTDFLNDLNRFVERELDERFDGKACLSDEVAVQARSDVKLRIFREAFAVVQQNVPSYRAVLQRIRDAYEEAIRIRDGRLREFDVMKSALLKLQKDVEWQKAAIWEDSMVRVVELLREKIDLLGVIDQVTTDKEEMRRVIDGLGKELEANHARLMEETDARRLVAYEYSQLSDQVEILRNKAKAVVQKPEKAADSDGVNDPVVLAMALAKNREALAKAQATITYMKTVYDAVCPLREYDALQGKYKEVEKTNVKLTNQIAGLEKQVKELERELEEAKVERNQVLLRMKNLQKNGTPRFDWTQCAEFVPGGLEAWEAMTEGKRSREKFALFMEQLTKPKDLGENFFRGYGKDADVPVYLRYDGQVYNRRYRLREVRIIVNDVWRRKMAENSREELAAFLARYAEESAPLRTLQVELAYNLVEGCKRYLHDPQVNLFYGILNGECQEEVYHAQRREMELLKEQAKNKMAALRSKTYLTGAAFCETLRETFPEKTETEVMALLEAATTDLGVTIGKSLNMVDLLADAEEGLEERAFGREMAEQFRAGRRRFAGEVAQALGDREVTVEDVRGALKATGMSPEKTEGCLRWVFRVPEGTSTEKASPLAAGEVTARLEKFAPR